MIRWYEPSIGEKEFELVKEVLESGYLSEGPKTKELEKRLGEIVNAKHIIMTTNATAALYLAIEADKTIRKYDNGFVMIPDLTFVATKNAVEMSGLNVAISDVDKNRFMLNKELNLNALPMIFMPVNLLGRSCARQKDLEEIDYMTVICDNAGALGSNVPNGKVGCYSLQCNKIITCSQGGFCATNDDEYAKVIRQIKDFGRVNKDDNHTNGFNFKFNDILSAVALGQLDSLEERKNNLCRQYAIYKRELNNYGEFVNFDIVSGEIPLWIEFICRCEEERDLLLDFLGEQGIECRKPWKPFIGLENSKFYANNVLWLPNGPTLSPEKQNKIIKSIKKFYEIKRNSL